MASSQNVLILSSNTGGGHRSAAHALENSLTRLHPGEILVKITQVLEESTFVSGRLADLYNFLLRDHQQLMKYYYWAIDKIRPNESKLIFKAAMGYGQRLFERYAPSSIVSVHPMTQHFFAYILKKLGLIHKIPFITVVTDPCYGFWRGWACEDVDLYYVATEEAKQQLIDYGVGSHKIRISGMPVHSRFHPVTLDERLQYRHMLGLDPDKFTVFLNSGWIGGGNIPRIYEELVRADMDIQAVFLAGQNERLIQEAHHISQVAKFPVKVMGYTEQMNHLMQASDIMVTKLGGLTTFESLACQLPIVGDTLTPPMPQEEQTTNFIQKTGTGVLLKRPEEIVSVVQSLLGSPEQMMSMRNAAGIHAKSGGSDRIARDVLEYMTTWSS